MKFNERVHAFIAAKYYHYLTKAFGERGRKAFVHATQYYAGQRGRRMAQRAIRDGAELTYQTYCRYGEWAPSPDLAPGDRHQSEVLSLGPDYKVKITVCPWHNQFAEMGLLEAGREYCKHLDSAICRGFNPYLTYQVPQSLNEEDCCIHIVRAANLDEGACLTKKGEYQRSFEFHCAHSYWSYNEVTAAIFGAQGEQVNGQVLEDFAATYGQEMADVLASYRGTNFNVATAGDKANNR